MAIYHFHGQVMSKVTKDGKPKSPLAVAAYRSGEKLTDEQIDKTFFYKREVQPETFILSPDHAPEWTRDRESLWNEVNKIERNYNAQFSREFNIALPIELSEEEQNNLAKEFCQEAFVDKGMVADISIHRDDTGNPHFHVMTTVRPFNQDGTWGAKSKREYIFDEENNHVLDKNGKNKFRKVNMTDWNDKETFNHWRKLWADKANQFLEANNIDERITHLSNKNLGTEKLPTIHEGYVSRKMQRAGKSSDRISHNDEVRSYNKKVELISEYKEQKNNIKMINKFSRKFSPQEKKTLSNIAKELRFFVNSDTLSERKMQLDKWKKSVLFKPDSEEKMKSLSRIEKEETAIKEAESILEKEANRFIETYYPTYDLNSLEYQEKVIIVDETLKQSNILTDDQIDQLHIDLTTNNLRNDLNSILKNRWVFIGNVQEHLLLAEVHLKTAKDDLGLTNDADENMIREAVKGKPIKAAEFKVAAKKVVELNKIIRLLNEFYNAEIQSLYPDINTDSLSMEEKELIIATHEYMGGKESNADGIVSRYSTEQQMEIIDIWRKPYVVKKELLINKYPDFQMNNPIHLMLLKEEALNNPDLPKEYFDKVIIIDPGKWGRYSINNAVPLEDINNQMNEQISQSGVQNTASTIVYGLRSVVSGLLSDRNNKGLSKKQFEQDLQNKNRKKKRYRGHSL